MALETVTGFETEAPLLPVCVTSSASLNLSLVSTKNGNGLLDRVGAQGVAVWLSFPPAPFVHLLPSSRAGRASVAPAQSISLESGRDIFRGGSRTLPGPPKGMV